MSRPVSSRPRGSIRPSSRWTLRTFAATLVLLLSGALGTPVLHALEPVTDDTTVTAEPTDETAEPAAGEAVVTDAAPTDGSGTSADPAAPEVEEATAADATARAETEAESTDAVGQVTGLTLTVVSDGTANSDGSWDTTDEPGQDSSATNGIVRTHDSVVYRWGYSVAEAGDITLTQTLPDGMSWVAAESTAVCVEGADAVSADGRTLTCTQDDLGTGAATYLVRATVDQGSQGQVMSSVLSAAGTDDSAAATVTVSAAPRFDMRLTSWPNGFTLGGESGEEYGQSAHVWISIFETIDPARGVRGSEGLSDTFTFTLDPSDMGEHAVVKACMMSAGQTGVGTKINGTSRTAVNSVPDAGAWSCSQETPGGPITVTVSGAITDLRSYPTQTTSGAAVTTRAYATFGQITLWIPNEDYPTSRQVTIRARDFDPDSISGRSNYGEGYTNGQEPGAADLGSVNMTQFTFATSTEDSLVTSLSRVYADDGTLINHDSPIPAGTTSTTSGQAPMSTGETLRFGGTVGGRSPWGDTYSDVALCSVWDESLLTGGLPEVGYGSSDIELTRVEYAHLDVTSDADRRSVDCGTSGDGATGWSSTVEGAGGADAVNAVRFTIPQLPVGSRYLGISLTRTDRAVPAGTPLPVFWQVRSAISERVGSSFDPTRQTNNVLGSRAISTDGEVSADLTWQDVVARPGTTQTITLRPTVVGAATGTRAAVTVPAGLSVIAGSWPAGMTPAVVENADGSSTYTFELGDLAESEPISPLTFDVTVSARLQMPATLTLTAVLTSGSDPRPADYRTTSASAVVNAASAFSTNLSASSLYAITGVPLVYTLSWVNGLETSMGAGSIVALLPFDGDSRGTTGLSGGVVLDDVAVSADMDVTVQYTTDAAAAVQTALAGDRSGATGITWVTSAQVVAGATAVRLVTGSIDPEMSGEATLTVVPGALTSSASLVADLSGTVAGLDQPLAGVATVRVASGNAQISGRVYDDQDYAWEQTGSSIGLAGVQVRVTGDGFGENGADDDGAGDDIVIDDADALVATTDGDGRYVVDGMVPGRWTVAVAPDTLPAGLLAAEVPDDELVITPAEDREGIDFGFIEPIAAPVLTDQDVRLAVGEHVTVALPAGTVDESATITSTTDPAVGAVVVAEDGRSVTFNAPQAGTGSTSFTYTVTDRARQTATATVRVTVLALPTAGDVNRTVGQAATAIDLAGLVTGDGATLTVTTAPGHGTATLAGTVLTYQATPGYVGDDAVGYTVTDSLGHTASGTVTLAVLAGPAAQDSAIWTTVGTVAAVDLTELGLAPDSMTVAVDTAPEHGAATITADGVLRYAPVAGFTGDDSLVYRLTDAAGQTDTGTIDVRVVLAVVTVPDMARTGVDAPVLIDVLANDTATEPAISSVTQPGSGTAVVEDGQVRYTPAAAFSGTDTFTYTVTDAVGQTAVGTVTVTVVAAPQVTDQVTLRVGTDGSVQRDLADTLTGDALTGAVSTGTTHGVLALDGTQIGYVPEAGYVGTDQGVLTWTDSVGQTVTQVVDITVVSGPVVQDHVLRIAAGTPVEVDVLADAEAATALTVTAISAPAHGTATTGADGVIT